MGRNVTIVLLVAACGDHHDGMTDASTNPGAEGLVTMPPVTCDVPAEGMLVDVSATTNIVGTGTAGSCTTAALQAAVDMGGPIRFDCGSAPVTITLTQAIVINNTAGADHFGDTVIDGGGMVTLSGNHASRIFALDACLPPFNSPHCDSFPHPHLTIERLTLVDANDTSPDGGGAIYRKGGALTVIDSHFSNNHCAVTGQDTAGGALRLIYPTPALVVGSTFDSNACSDGGAIGSLGASPVSIINSTVTNNTATGNGGNPGNGGNAGGIYHDGGAISLSLCGVKVTGNHGNAYGGGLFYVDDNGQGTVSITNTEISDNDIPVGSGKPSHGGGGYIQGADVVMTNVTIAHNSAGFAAGMYINSMNGRGSLNATNVTVANHTGNGLHLEGGVDGTLLNCTIAANTAQGVHGAAPMKVINSLVVGNGTQCDAMPTTTMNTLEFGAGTCGGTNADPMLGTLVDNQSMTGVRTMAPVEGGPAMFSAGPGCPATDARGKTRAPDECTGGAHENGQPGI